MEETPQGPSDNAPPPAPPVSDPPPPPPESSAPEVVSSNRNIMIVLSYLGLLALIPLLVDKEDSEVQWHAKHGLVLFGAEFVVMIGLMVIGGILGAVSGGLGCIFGLLWPVFMLVILIVHDVLRLGGTKLFGRFHKEDVFPFFIFAAYFARPCLRLLYGWCLLMWRSALFES